MFDYIRNLFSKKDYLLIDSMHSCCYVPKHTFKHFDTMLMEGIEAGRKDKSVRFLWSSHGTRLHINPATVDKACTHGYTRDTKKRVIIPCPYIQQILHANNLPYDWCGRIYLEKTEPVGGSLASFEVVAK